jgi:hypothetical protein
MSTTATFTNGGLEDEDKRRALKELQAFLAELDQINKLRLTTLSPETVTRSHKFNDRDHTGLAAGTAAPEEHLPRYFAKNGHIDADPKKVKKNGGGKGNWYAHTQHPVFNHIADSFNRGHDGEEIQDENFRLANARRRSNSSSYAAGLKDFKTKFETVENDPQFNEAVHGALPEEEEEYETASRTTTQSSEDSEIAVDHVVVEKH